MFNSGGFDLSFKMQRNIFYQNKNNQLNFSFKYYCHRYFRRCQFRYELSRKRL